MLVLQSLDERVQALENLITSSFAAQLAVRVHHKSALCTRDGSVSRRGGGRGGFTTDLINKVV